MEAPFIEKNLDSSLFFLPCVATNRRMMYFLREYKCTIWITLFISWMLVPLSCFVPIWFLISFVLYVYFNLGIHDKVPLCGSVLLQLYFSSVDIAKVESATHWTEGVTRYTLRSDINTTCSPIYRPAGWHLGFHTLYHHKQKEKT
jgi:hypothetical protein